MIQAKELRFGNKVQTQHGDIITVQQILSNTLIYDTQIKVTREVASVRTSHKSSYTSQFVEVIKEADFQDIEPIVLTPKVLNKCGFRNYIREEWILRIEGSHIDFEFTEDGLRLKHAAPWQVRIKYLHELQNFLFAIAGYELEVELQERF
ncbi:MAG TPA: hypothetical protein VNS58_06260 [Puia sp.]|nr:hypothetical protein [Puia sp.]